MDAGKIALFPGSVDDLNRIESLSNSGRRYELMPIDGGRKYLTGVIIPSPTELRELMNAQISGMAAFKETELASDLDLEPKELAELENQVGEAYELIEQLAKQMFGKPEIMRMDIRMKAKEVGANGLVHVQLYNKEGLYMGVPVKL